MKKVSIIIPLIYLSLSIAVFVSPGIVCAYDSVITGQNNAETDVKAIQEAVDKGGTVHLKGTFNFGEKGQVKIKNDIEISGEVDKAGSLNTKIVGGFWPFHSPLPLAKPPLPGPGPKIKIKNIHFDGAVLTPMHFPYISGAEISGNKITNIKPSGMFVAGVLFGTRFARNEKIIPGAVTGNLIFKNNEVDLKCEKPESTMGQGAFFILTWGASIEITQNTITNVSRNAIESLDNYLDEEGRGSVLIAENNIVTPSVGIPIPSTSTPNGIVVGWFLDLAGGSDPTRNSKITVIKNYVQTHGDTSIGIASIADGVAILDNMVEVKGGSGSTGIMQLGSNSFIARNKIAGAGAWALQAVSWISTKANGNTFAWNDIKEFRSSAGDFLCAGNNNVFIGENCKVVDKGEMNRMFLKYQ